MHQQEQRDRDQVHAQTPLCTARSTTSSAVGRLGLLVARQVAADDVDEFVDERDQQNDQPRRIADLRNPHRDRDHALRHLVEAPGVADELAGVEREEADEADADDEADDLDPMPALVRQLVDQQADPDHLAAAEGVGEAEERHRRHAPGDEIVGRRNVQADRPPGRQQHHQHENRQHERAGEIAREEVETIKKNPHDAPQPDDR